MSDDQTWTLKEYLFAMLAGAFVLVVNGAVPFLMLPTLGQAVWTTGFSQSFANGSLFDFYVHDFGLPKPAAIAFGLAGAWPASLLIRVGLHPADAYSGMAAAWFLLAMYSACRIAREFGASRVIALLGSVAWMTMPVIWEHAGYSMVSIGIALLPFYFFSACMLFLLAPRTTQITRKAIALYFTATIVAVFMDGYTFMMFATGASILLLYSLLARSEIRPVLIRKAIPVHVVSFALAYIIFSTYIGRSNFDAQPIDFFRGWGLDLSFIGIPTKGVLWLPDLLGLSVPRSNELHFGDASVWRTSFALPVLLLGLFSWWRTRTNLKVATGVLLVAVLGFYMALGPSLKINSTKPESLQLSNPRQQSSMMAADIAVMPTGSAWVSTTLPGFNVMRASYRWVALGVLASWFLIMISVSRKGVGNRTVWIFGLVALVLLNLPNIEESWRKSVGHRVAFHKIDRELVAEFRQHIQRGEKVAFIPWHNDFFANYLAPRGGLARDVIVTGYVTDAQLASLYAHARFLAMPSLYEGFGLPIIEAMSCGVPVLTSNVSSLPEVAGDAGLLVDPLSEEDIADGICRLFADDNLHTVLAERARPNTQRFSWHRAALEARAVFSEAMTERRGWRARST